MSFTLEITQARFSKELRHGVSFIIRNENGRITSKGRIKPSGKMVYTGAFSHMVGARMTRIAKAYGADGVMPDDCIFVEEGATADTLPAPPSEPPPKKATKRKARKAAKGE